MASTPYVTAGTSTPVPYVVASSDTETMTTITTDETGITRVLNELRLSRFEEEFIEMGIEEESDIEILSLEDIQELGIEKIGDRNRLLKWIKERQSKSPGHNVNTESKPVQMPSNVTDKINNQTEPKLADDSPKSVREECKLSYVTSSPSYEYCQIDYPSVPEEYKASCVRSVPSEEAIEVQYEDPSFTLSTSSYPSVPDKYKVETAASSTQTSHVPTESKYYTVTVTKKYVDDKVGLAVIGLQGQEQKHVIVQAVRSDGIFGGSEVRVGARLLKINNVDVDGFPAKEVVAYIKLLVGSITFLFVDGPCAQTARANEVVYTTVEKTPEGKIGLKFGEFPNVDGVLVTGFVPGGPTSNTVLKKGMKILSIQGVSTGDLGSRAVREVIASCPRALTIVACMTTMVYTTYLYESKAPPNPVAAVPIKPPPSKIDATTKLPTSPQRDPIVTAAPICDGSGVASGASAARVNNANSAGGGGGSGRQTHLGAFARTFAREIGKEILFNAAGAIGEGVGEAIADAITGSNEEEEEE